MWMVEKAYLVWIIEIITATPVVAKCNVDCNSISAFYKFSALQIQRHFIIVMPPHLIPKIIKKTNTTLQFAVRVLVLDIK